MVKQAVQYVVCSSRNNFTDLIHDASVAFRALFATVGKVVSVQPALVTARTLDIGFAATTARGLVAVGIQGARWIAQARRTALLGEVEVTRSTRVATPASHPRPARTLTSLQIAHVP